MIQEVQAHNPGMRGEAIIEASASNVFAVQVVVDGRRYDLSERDGWLSIHCGVDGFRDMEIRPGGGNQISIRSCIVTGRGDDSDKPGHGEAAAGV